MVEYSRNLISNAQGYAEPEIADVNLDPAEPPKPPPTKEEIES